MDFLPINIRISDAKILIVGGGKVATHKATILSRFTNRAKVIAPEVNDKIKALPFKLEERHFVETDLDGVSLLFVCTDNHQLNHHIHQLARQRGILTSVCDSPSECDFTSPAIYRDGDLTISVASDAKDVKRCIAIRDRIAALASNQQQVPGGVTLVGFGPGDPELLTMKAIKALQQADIIFHDDLVDKEFLKTFPAELIYVGKRSGHHSAEQHEINQMLLEAALRGKRVVRLKGGDPMLFAHAQEEICYLENRGIEVTVVPGITTASALAARAKVSLTERGVSQSVALINGHANRPLTPDAETLVYYMSGSKLQQIAQALIARGKRPGTPVLLASNLSTPHEQFVHTTLTELTKKEPDYPTPLIALIGDVAQNK